MKYHSTKTAIKISRKKFTPHIHVFLKDDRAAKSWFSSEDSPKAVVM